MSRPLTPAPKPPARGKRRPSPMKRGRGIKARSKRSKKSGGHLFPKGVDEAYRAWIRAKPCLIWGRWEQRGPHSLWCGIEPLDHQHQCIVPGQCAHVKSRGAGGIDHGNCIPLCYEAHHEQHCIGISAFAKRWGVNLKAEAEKLSAEYRGGAGV